MGEQYFGCPHLSQVPFLQTATRNVGLGAMILIRHSWKSIVVATAAICCTAATPLHYAPLRFRVTIPDGFEPETESPKREHDLYRFVRPAADPAAPRIAVVISWLGGKLPPGGVVKERTENGVRIEPMSMVWKTHTLVGARSVGAVGGQGRVSLSVQVPLTPGAIMITAAGDSGDEQEVSDALRAILGTVEGESNWITGGGGVTTKERQEARHLIAKDAYAFAAVLIPLGILFYLWRRSRRHSLEAKEPTPPT